MESGDVGNVGTPSREEPGPPTRRSRFTAEIIVYLPREESEILERALRPEAEDIPSKRTSVEVDAVEEGLRLRVEAVDLTALRAALNSFLRFADSTLNSIKRIESLGEE